MGNCHILNSWKFKSWGQAVAAEATVEIEMDIETRSERRLEGHFVSISITHCIPMCFLIREWALCSKSYRPGAALSSFSPRGSLTSASCFITQNRTGFWLSFIPNYSDQQWDCSVPTTLVEAVKTYSVRVFQHHYWTHGRGKGFKERDIGVPEQSPGRPRA